MSAPLAGYVRVSHVGRRGRERDDFHAPDDQGREILAWAKAHGRRVEVLPPELDRKGNDAARPIFRQAVDGVRASAYSGVVVAYLSRAGRDLRLMLDLWDEVEAAGGAVFSARENVDASTPAGRLHRNVLAAVAQHELEERREGFDRDRAKAVARGIWQRRQTPRGYRRDSQTRKLVRDRSADSVRAAFDAFLSGTTTISELARRLRMTPSGVRQLLRNRVYLGELRVGEHVNPKAHEPLVHQDMFEATQHKLADGVRPPRSRNGPALLAGLVRCASCGHVMSRSSSGSRHVYVCPGAHSGERCPQRTAVTASLLDAHVEPIALSQLARLHVTATAGRKLKRAQAKLEEAERELATYLEAVSAADAGVDAFSRAARKRSDDVEAARAEVQSELARHPVIPTFESGADAWPTLNSYERNALLRPLLSAVIVRPVGRGQRVAIEDRARVMAHGTDVGLPDRRGGEASGVTSIAFPDADGVGVLSVPVGKQKS